MKKSIRNARMRTLYCQGFTLERIGKRYSVSRERVRQILEEAGITYKQGGRSVAMQKARERRREEVQKERDVRSISFYGCVSNISKACPWGIRNLYLKQKSNAVQRSIPWQLTLPQWLKIWGDSGKFEQRGRCRGEYVMARLGDTGPYAVGNVHIIQCSDNVHEAIENLKAKGIPWGVNHPKHKVSRKRKQLCLPLE